MLKNDRKLRCRSETLKLIDDVPEKDVELCLEVEMDDEVKEIITFPEKYASTLLDVTVIKPKDIDKLYTFQKNTMTGEAVRKFMQAMNLRSEPASLTSTPRKGYTAEEARQRVKQVYTTPRTFHEQIRANFECKKKKNHQEVDEKLNTPCVCQNCAIVGVVTDSQKKPFATEALHDPREDYPRRRKKLELKTHEHVECEYYFKQLSERIKHLEARVALQEEKSVPKDYFRRIITKLVNHITKISSYGNAVKLPASPAAPRRPHKYVVNPVLVEAKEEPPPSPQLWKWGGEILKPGIDLKNKIVVLMEDTLGNLKRTKERTREEEVRSFVKEFSREVPEREAAPGGDSKERKRLYSRLFRREPAGDAVNVEYVSSKVLKWRDTETTFKFESSDVESARDCWRRKTNDPHRVEFTRTLLNTKTEDKVKLWDSIWEQAAANGQTKRDKVTIQLPDRKDPKKGSIEIVYTLADLEKLLMGKQPVSFSTL